MQDTFVGRETELATLEAHLREALEGRGRVVFVTGEAGIGKTALIRRFCQCVLTRYPDVRFAAAECDHPIGDVDVGALSPYAPFKALIGQLVTQEKERGEHWALTYLREVGPSWLGLIPGVGGLIAALGDTAAFVWERRKESRPPGPAGGGPLGQEEIFQQAVDTFTGIAARYNPLVLFVDDWHWADDSSTNLLFHLARQVGRSRLLFLASFRLHDTRTAREGRGHPILQVQNELRRYGLCADIELAFLDRRAVDEYLHIVFPTARFAPTLRDWLFDVSDGSPLFLTEYVRLLREDGSLTPDGAFHGDLTQVQVPRGAMGVIEERLRRLSDDLRRTLAYASAEGERFTTLVLARLLECDRLSLLEKLQIVEKVHELIVGLGTETLLGEKTTRYTFKHTLVYRALYESLSEEQRELLHGRIVEWLGEEYAAATGAERQPLATQLVAHAAEAGDYLQEARFALEAARAARESYAHDEVLRQCALGLSALGRLTAPGGDAEELELALLFESGRTERFIGHWPEALRTFEQVAARARALDHTPLLAQASYYIGWVSHLLGRSDEALRAYEESRALFESLGDRAWLATTYNNIGSLYDARGDTDAALEWYERSAALKEELGDQAGLAATYSNIGGIYEARGDLDAALEWYRKDLAISEELGNRAGLAATYNNIGSIYEARGDVEAALTWYERSVALKEELGDRAGLATTYNNIGSVYRVLGDPEAALAWYRRSAALFEELGDRVGLARTLNNIGAVHRSSGNFDAALEWYGRARLIQEELGDRLGLATTGNNIGATCRSRGDLDAAMEWYGRSVALFEELGNDAGLATTCSNIASIHQARGETDAALAWYERARAIREELGDRAGLAALCNNIATVYTTREDYDAALKWYRQSVSLCEALGNRAGLATACANMALTYETCNDPDGALVWYERARVIQEEWGDAPGLALTWFGIGLAALDKGQYERALDAFTRSRDLSAQLGLEQDAAEAEEMIAEAQRRAGG